MNKLTTLILAAVLMLPVSLAAQSARTGINQNFLEPGQASGRQVEHNHFFVTDAPKAPGQILDLQTSQYALAERPAGLSYDVYSAIGYGLATSMMVVGPGLDADGHRQVIIIDTLEDFGAGKDVAGLYLDLYNGTYGTDLTKLPIDTIIYTHNHIDHTGGVLGYLAMAEDDPCPEQDPSIRGLGGVYRARANCVEVISQEKVVDAVVNTSTVSGQIIQARSNYMYGLALHNELSPIQNPKPLGVAITNGIGPYLSRGLAGFRIPSRTFAEEMGLRSAGLTMQLIYVPNETNDELAVFVPDALNGGKNLRNPESGLLFSAEVIQGPAFPNLYSLRGTQYRSPANWYHSVRRLAQYDSWCMVPSHGPPVCQRDNIQRLLTTFGDAVQFTHDQTVRFMNMGFTPNELVERVLVPSEALFAELDPMVPWPNAPGSTLKGPVQVQDYLLPFYGSVPQAVRETYFGYVGWFDGDPVHLEPVPPADAARRLVALINSGTDLLEAATEALRAGDAQWAAELATLGIEANPEDRALRQIKSQAYVALGERALNPNWSDWFFTSANELVSEEECFLPYLPGGLVSPVTQSAVPIADWVNSWFWKINGREAADAGARNTLGLWFEPTRQDFGPRGFTLRLRHGIVDIAPWEGTRETWQRQVDTALLMSQDTLDALILGRAFDRLEIEKIAAHEGVRFLKGDVETLKAFFQYFDPTPTCQPAITVPRR
jgi:alkyl sulfatase BDS1-like metallo-beta-lactamase superfamily hydrolase